MAAENVGSSETALKSIFEEGWKSLLSIQERDVPTNSEEVQNDIVKAIKLFEDSTKMVNMISIFSRNEHIDEVSATNLRYFLLPAFMGELSLLQQGNDRSSDVTKSKIYFLDFLQRCNDYSITDLDLKQFCADEEKESKPIRPNVSTDRQAKIDRYKETKALKEKISKLEQKLKLSPESVDEETQREYYLSWIRLWVNESVDKLSLITSELEILEHMKKLQTGKIKPEEKPKPREPIKPILITKESIKSKVFGAGYPSLPSMTPEQWMDKQIADGKVVLDYNPNVNSAPTEHSSDDEDDDDDEKIQKARAWDEWKDEHKRGEGNRKDRG
ncbi:immunoglobulin-binding protein 1-like [Rhopilema esculentum]|uniref:immunoglobulin-binding protein 1-like n=1 Tax=Rhopilema esculentum TaxID=499914 RepID=UPI0031E00C7E